MIDSLVKLTEKIVELLKYRQTRKKLLFDEFAKPLYDQIAIVHQDYLSMLGKVKTALETGESLASICTTFSPDRSEKEAQRRAVRPLTNALLLDNKFAEFQPFLEAVDHYFSGPGPTSSSYSIIVETELRAAQRREEVVNATFVGRLFNRRSDYVEAPLRNVTNNIESLRRYWGRIVEEYAKLKIDSVA